MIAMKGGSVINEQSRRLIERIGQVPVGKAVLTDAGICHANLSSIQLDRYGAKEMNRRNCAVPYGNVLTLAELYNLRSVSMPAVSSGIFGFPKPLCAEILLDAAIKFLQQPDIELTEVVMCNFDQATAEIFWAAEQKLKAR